MRSGDSLGARVTRLALAIPVAYHGAWNLGAVGALWWATESGLPPALRFLVGAGELAASVALATGVMHRAAAACLVPIFVGAIPQHWSRGFSFKNGGWEPALVYALLALSIALTPSAGATVARRAERTLP